MCREDRTLREAELRLREHRELRQALGLRRIDETAFRTAGGVLRPTAPVRPTSRRHGGD